MICKLFVVGAGGHCRVFISIFNNMKNYEIVGIADRDRKFFGEIILGTSIKYWWDKLE